MRLAQIIDETHSYLKQSGIDNPALDTQLLIGHALGLDRAQLLSQSQRVLTLTDTEKIKALVERRARHESVARIIGEREFWSLPFGLNEATLEPRPDSETLIETTLDRLKTRRDTPLRFLDLGTGTGCLLLSLIHECPHATGLGIDLAPRAIEQATINANKLGLAARVDFQTGNWLDAVHGRFDLIITNPPYIAQSDMAALMPEVREYDPLLALIGGKTGLEIYRLLAPQLQAFLNPSGLVVFETGIGQAADVAALLTAHGFKDVAITKDLGLIDRCVSATAP